MGPAIDDLLRGEDAEDLLAAALATRGLALRSWTRTSVHARPGAETSVGYDVETSAGRLYLVASTAALSPEQREASGVVRLESAAGAVHVWQHPDDPVLVGLATACTPALLAEALTRVEGVPVAVPTLEMIVHRPLRRAVVRAQIESDGLRRVVYVKVVRPTRGPGLVRRHAMTDLAPRAIDLGEGAVVIAQADGIPLTEALHRPHGGTVAVDPALLDQVLGSLPADAVRLRRRPAVADRLPSYVDALRSRLGDEPRVGSLAARIQDRLRRTTVESDDPTHGDLHPANVFVDSAGRPSRITALIDVDTLGPGRRSDDLASYIAHLAVLPTVDPVGYADVPEVTSDHLRHAASRVGEADLRARAAAHLVALASGADDALVEPWTALAEEMLG